MGTALYPFTQFSTVPGVRCTLILFCVHVCMNGEGRPYARYGFSSVTEVSGDCEDCTAETNIRIRTYDSDGLRRTFAYVHSL